MMVEGDMALAQREAMHAIPPGALGGQAVATSARAVSAKGTEARGL